jgi:hypothetical protein
VRAVEIARLADVVERDRQRLHAETAEWALRMAALENRKKAIQEGGDVA